MFDQYFSKETEGDALKGLSFLSIFLIGCKMVESKRLGRTGNFNCKSVFVLTY